MRRGVVIAQDSGNRTIETHLAGTMAGLEAQHGDPLAALDYFLVSIRHLHDSGNSTTIRATLADLAPPFSTGSGTEDGSLSYTNSLLGIARLLSRSAAPWLFSLPAVIRRGNGGVEPHLEGTTTGTCARKSSNRSSQPPATGHRRPSTATTPR
jgi:hypothetical protein